MGDHKLPGLELVLHFSPPSSNNMNLFTTTALKFKTMDLHFKA